MKPLSLSTFRAHRNRHQPGEIGDESAAPPGDELRAPDRVVHSPGNHLDSLACRPLDQRRRHHRIRREQVSNAPVAEPFQISGRRTVDERPQLATPAELAQSGEDSEIEGGNQQSGPVTDLLEKLGFPSPLLHFEIEKHPAGERLQGRESLDRVPARELELTQREVLHRKPVHMRIVEKNDGAIPQSTHVGLDAFSPLRESRTEALERVLTLDSGRAAVAQNQGERSHGSQMS